MSRFGHRRCPDAGWPNGWRPVSARWAMEEPRLAARVCRHLTAAGENTSLSMPDSTGLRGMQPGDDGLSGRALSSMSSHSHQRGRERPPWRRSGSGSRRKEGGVSCFQARLVTWPGSERSVIAGSRRRGVGTGEGCLGRLLPWPWKRGRVRRGGRRGRRGRRLGTD